MRLQHPLLVLALAGATACGTPTNGPQMMPGSNCMTCHAEGGTSSHAWTVAGTVFNGPKGSSALLVYGAQVQVTDANGTELTLGTNGAGNFYTAEPLAFPIQVAVQYGDKVMKMQQAPPNGSCNSCHSGNGLNGASGELYVPTN